MKEYKIPFQLLIFFCVIFATNTTFSQSTAKIGFNLSFGDDNYTLMQETDSNLIVDRARFYVGHITLYNNGQKVYTDSTDYYLIDFEDESTTQISLDNLQETPYDSLTIRLGTDSLSNVSGALEGALDPMYGMYWTWNSGYINFKLEGTSPLCKTRKNEFRYHIGGYQSPNETTQLLSFNIPQKESYTITLNLEEFFKSVSLSERPNLMLPGEKAANIAQSLPCMFTIK